MSVQSPLAFYQDMLQSFGFVESEGLLSYQTLKTQPSTQWTIDGKRVCLPLPEILASQTTWEHLQAFHPLCESSHLGESKVIQGLLAATQQRLADVIRVCLVGLFGMVMDSTVHAAIPPEHAGLLHNFSNTTPAQAKQISALLSKIPYKEIVKVYLRRGGTYKGKKYYRVCGVMFPMINTIRSPVEGRVYDVKVDEKSRNLLLRAMEYLLPDLDKMEQYTAPSNCDVAPYFQALIHAYYNVMTPLVKFLTNFKDALPDMMDIPNLSWYEKSLDFTPYNDIIPSLPGNEGETPKSTGGVKPTATTGAALLQTQQHTTPHTAPAAPEPVQAAPAAGVIAPGWGALPRPQPPTVSPTMTNTVTTPSGAGAVDTGLFSPQPQPQNFGFSAAPPVPMNQQKITAYVQQNGQMIPVYESNAGISPVTNHQPQFHNHTQPQPTAQPVNWNSVDLGQLTRGAPAPANTHTGGLTAVSYPTQANVNTGGSWYI